VTVNDCLFGGADTSLLEPADQQPHERKPHPLASEVSLLTALRSAPRGSGAGITGWRYEHLQALLPDDGEGGLGLLLPVAEAILNSRLPADIARILSAARLTGLTKKTGGVRPIAVGDVLRRWPTRAICIEHKKEWEEHFAPWQFAIGVSSGPEKLAASVRSYLESSTDRGVVCLDAKNAFNEADRQQIMDAVALDYPQLLDYFWQWYGEPAELWFTKADGSIEVILSSEGTQQGDPAAPFLFSLGLQRRLAASAALSIRPHVTAFMDDVQVAAPCTELGAAARHTMTCLQEYMPMADKSKAFSPAGLPIPGLPADVRISPDGLLMVGVPLGSREFLLSQLQQKATEATTVLPHLAHLSAQTAVLLLRFCVNPRIHFALRTIAPADAPGGKAILQAYDTAIFSSFESAIGLAPGALSLTEQLQVGLPVSMGGFGLPRAALLWNAAYYGCAGATLHSVLSRSTERDGQPCLPGPSTADAIAALPWVHAADSARLPLLELRVPPPGGRGDRATQHLDTAGALEPPTEVEELLPAASEQLKAAERFPPPLELAKHPLPGLQTRGTQSVSFHAFCNRRWGAETALSVAGTARLLSCIGPGSGAWLFALPSCASQRFSDPQFHVACQLRLGHAIAQCAVAGRCSCGATVDPLGYHFLCCNHGVERNWRHDTTRDTLADIARQSGHAATTEKTLQALGIRSSHPDKRLDVVCFKKQGFTTGIDVSIVFPAAKDYVVAASKTPGATALAAEAKKDAHYVSDLKTAGYQFVPAIAEVFGRWGPAMPQFLRSLLPPAESVNQGLYAKILHMWWRRLSCAVQKGNAFMLLSRSISAVDSNTAPDKRRRQQPRWADFLLCDMA
jgi:hypothetical protein